MTKFPAPALAGLVATAITMTALDFVWLGFVAREFYADALGPLLRPSPQPVAAASFYFLYVAAVWLVAVRRKTVGQALLTGAAMGAFGYGVYELTNWAVIVGWPARLVIVDWLWGTFLTGVCAAVGAAAQRR